MKKTFFIIDRILIIVTISLFIILLGLMTTQVMLRYVFHTPIRGVIIYSNLLFTWLAYLGCAFVARDNSHLRVEFFIEKLPEKIIIILNAVYRLCPLFVLILLSKPIYKFYEFQRGITVAGAGFPVSYFTYAFVVGFSLIAIYTLIKTDSDIESIFMENDE
ncbi:MAG: TRAP transporter small permease [Deltaproteobacteria bacterium]|nr:TRAP transporter small permease [Candidatus Desulfobacula maris]